MKFGYNRSSGFRGDVEIVDGQRTDGQTTTESAHPISSPALSAQVS